VTPSSPAVAGAWLSTLRGLGLRSLSLQALHRARLRSGWYQRSLPASAWTPLPDQVVRSARPVFATPERSQVHPHVAEPEAALEAGRKIAAGQLLYFSSRWLDRPQDWRTHPLTGFNTPLSHWSDLPPFAGSAQGDVKWIWEASRFDWIYSLGRAWAAASDDADSEVFAETFWTLLDSWTQHNPPNTGINWRCGQECAFRLIALVWAAGSLGQAECSTDERMASLWMVVEGLAQRIDRAMAHALSQNNNHGLSEAVALFLAGTALPGHPLAGQWYGKGMRHFTAEVERQFTVDGGYAQHSFNYTRVALRDAFVFVAALQFYEDEVPAGVHDRIVAAAELLYQAQEESCGQVPNYGANDGANILSLSGCAYEDFRPLLQLLSWQLDERRIYPPGPWDEELAWHCDAEALVAPVHPRRRRSFGRETSGYYGIRGERSFGLIRCHSFSNRPGDADMLHFDLWRDGLNVLPDRGSYSYNDEAGWGLALRGTACHNTVTVDGRDQMTRGGRFLWLDWTRVQQHSFGRHQIAHWDGWLFDGEHQGYTSGDSGVTHRRQVFQSDDQWAVIDDLLFLDAVSHKITLRWLVHQDTPEDFPVTVFGPGTTDITLGDSGLPANGVSRTYGEITAHKLLVREVESATSIRWVTLFGAPPESSNGGLDWSGLHIPLEPGGAVQ
jgi:hypothetical protein